MDQNGVRCDSSKVQKVLEWPVPSNVTELRQLLGLVGYYRRFIQNCSTITAPLTKLLKKSCSRKIPNLFGMQIVKMLLKR